jgi:hypothetical protein
MAVMCRQQPAMSQVRCLNRREDSDKYVFICFAMFDEDSHLKQGDKVDCRHALGIVCS